MKHILDLRELFFGNAIVQNKQEPQTWPQHPAENKHLDIHTPLRRHLGIFHLAPFQKKHVDEKQTRLLLYGAIEFVNGAVYY